MTDTELEDRVRAALHAVADATPLDAAPRSPRRRVAPYLAIAAALAIVVGAVALIDRDDAEDVRVTAPPTTTEPDAPSPLPASFDVRAGNPVFTGDGTADDVANAYLRARFPDHPSPGVHVETVETEGDLGRTRWSTGSELEGTLGSGELHLRIVDGHWSVIAATTDGLDLSALTYDGERVRGTVRSTSDESFQVELVSWRTEPSHDGSGPFSFGPAHGELEVDSPLPLQPVTARVMHLGGTVLAIAEVRFDPPPLPHHRDLDACVAEHTGEPDPPAPVVHRLCAAALDGTVIAREEDRHAWELVATDEPSGHWVTLRWRDLVGTFRMQTDGDFDSLFTQLGPCCTMNDDVVVAGALNRDATGLQLVLGDRRVGATSFPDPETGVQYAVVVIPHDQIPRDDTNVLVQVRIGEEWRDAAEIDLATIGG